MKIDVIDVSFSKDKAMMFSKLFANKDPLFDFINFFSVQLIMVTKSLMVKLILKFLTKNLEVVVLLFVMIMKTKLF